MFLNIVNYYLVMYCDIVLASKDNDLEDFAKKIGYSKLIFKEDFNKLGLIISKDYSTNRKLVENKKIKILVNPHVNSFRDSLHFRASGLDHVICSLCNKNNVSIGISLDSINDPIMLGRVKQNIKLCRKYKVRMLFFSFAKNNYELRSVHDMLSFLRSIGMTGKEAKNSLFY